MARQNGTGTFTAGAFAGAVGGFALGIFFGKYALQLVSLLYSLGGRRGGSDDRLRFEWLLQ